MLGRFVLVLGDDVPVVGDLIELEVAAHLIELTPAGSDPTEPTLPADPAVLALST